VDARTTERHRDRAARAGRGRTSSPSCGPMIDTSDMFRAFRESQLLGQE
jgi:hypothetical protein